MNKTPQKKGLTLPEDQKARCGPHKKRRFKIAALVIMAVICLSATTLFALAWSPELGIDNPNPAKLTPGQCALFISLPALDAGLTRLERTQAAKQLQASGATQAFWDLVFGERYKKLQEKFHGLLTPERLRKLSGQEFSFTSFGSSKDQSYLLITKLGTLQKAVVNLARHKFGKPDKYDRFYVQKVGSGESTFYVTMGGGYLFLSSSRDVLEKSLDLALGRSEDSVAAQRLYQAADTSGNSNDLFLEWFAPGDGLKTPLTNFQVNHGALRFSADGMVLRTVTRAQDRGPGAAPLNDAPCHLVPETVSLFMTTAQFGRVWDDLLLGKAFKPDHAENFMQDLYNFGVKDLSEHFGGQAAMAVDGVFRAEDRTPVPQLIFAWEVKQPEGVMEKVRTIFAKSLKESFKNHTRKRNNIDYEVFQHEYESSEIEPTYAVAQGYLFFTITEREMQRVLDTVAQKNASMGGKDVFKQYFKVEDLHSDMYVHIDGRRLAAGAADYFTWFGDISSPGLAGVLAEVVVPFTDTFKHVPAGAGRFHYDGDILRGETTFHTGGGV